MSKRSQEGYLLIDNRVNPGVPEADIAAVGLPPGAGRGVFEAPTYTCSHCQRVVVINPLRSRERGYCGKCDHYLCDACEAVRVQTGVCRTVREYIETLHEETVKRLLV